jgi:hypothetical protein
MNCRLDYRPARATPTSSDSCWSATASNKKILFLLFFFMWIVHANWSRENRPPPGRWAAEPLLCYLKFCCYYTRRPFVSLYTILPPSISFPLFIYFQFHHLPHLFPPMFIMCLAVCVLLLLIISLLSFRLYSYIYNDLSIYRVFWQPTCSTGPRVEESSNSHILPKFFLLYCCHCWLVCLFCFVYPGLEEYMGVYLA